MEQNEKSDPVDDNLVDFDGPDDPLNPLNWPFRKKIVVTFLYSLCTLGSTWASTIYSSGVVQVQRQFNVGNEVALLGLALYLAGNAFGPLLWAPVSEAYGRKPSVLIPIFGLMLFTFAFAVAKDLQSLLIARFFGGVFGGAPQSNVGGVMADIWAPTERGAALLCWGMAVAVGPMLAPIVGSALVVSLPHTGWRWTGYVTGIFLSAIIAASIFWIEESYPPVLLARKANHIRHETKNWALHSKSQEVGTSIKATPQKYLIVPLEMFIEPIALFMSLYGAFCYAIAYLSIVREWNPVEGSLPFLAMIIGVLLAPVALMWGQVYYRKRLITNGGQGVPEARLMPMMIGSIVFPIGLFIMGWTAQRNIHWIGFCFGTSLVGFGFFVIFQSALSYIVDTYVTLAASALAANMFVRSILAAAFPLFARSLYERLGLDWGMSFLGFIAVAMILTPFVFYIFGKRIRARGKRSSLSFAS
ncbi:major facilitator superfamily domain-containing protein [Clohesyomyces aquaticus]|uniref:Major facilitator superfamily domain-containing protein n=1 Tax=Clohesyomyces aquaticus TaxID=1231657 RepID=A0A1Y1YLD3_9PLEO|nr:major facilitator superfamily domain-containing protein [Clohesyomyces aquaticus]